MATTRVAPKPPRVVLGRRSLLQQQPIVGIKDENGNSAMQFSAPVSGHLASNTGYVVTRVHQYNLFFHRSPSQKMKPIWRP